MSYEVEKVWNCGNNICVVVFIKDMGHRCGYVGIDKTHPLYGEGYNSEPDKIQRYYEKIKESPIGKRGILDVFTFGINDKLRVGDLFDVHGGITYSRSGLYPIEICDEKHEYNPWWFGFDCAHAGDARDLEKMGGESKKYYVTWNEGEIRTLEYCIEECESLSKQLDEFKTLMEEEL